MGRSSEDQQGKRRGSYKRKTAPSLEWTVDELEAIVRLVNNSPLEFDIAKRRIAELVVLDRRQVTRLEALASESGLTIDEEKLLHSARSSEVRHLIALGLDKRRLEGDQPLTDDPPPQVEDDEP